jgi:hypothetical protein
MREFSLKNALRREDTIMSLKRREADDPDKADDSENLGVELHAQNHLAAPYERQAAISTLKELRKQLHSYRDFSRKR